MSFHNCELSTYYPILNAVYFAPYDGVVSLTVRNRKVHRKISLCALGKKSITIQKNNIT